MARTVGKFPKSGHYESKRTSIKTPAPEPLTPALVDAIEKAIAKRMEEEERMILGACGVTESNEAPTALTAEALEAAFDQANALPRSRPYRGYDLTTVIMDDLPSPRDKWWSQTPWLQEFPGTFIGAVQDTLNNEPHTPPKPKPQRPEEFGSW